MFDQARRTVRAWEKVNVIRRRVAMTAIDARRREMSRLKREISYYCGVSVRTERRERIQRAHAAIRQRERQLQQTSSTSANPGGRDD